MSTPAPCDPWTTDELVRACCDGLAEDFDLTASIALASTILWSKSGRQYGTCEATIRPCLGINCGCVAGSRTGWASWLWSLPGLPWHDSTGWHNLQLAGCCAGRCDLSTVILERVVSIDSVTIDGVVLPADAYQVVDGDRLERIDGGRWPCTQNRALPATEPDTFEIVYTYGTPIPPGADQLAGVLACDIAKSLCGGNAGCLPEGLIDQIVRDGVTIEYETVAEAMADNRLGIDIIDNWVSAVNPDKITRPATIHRADDPALLRRHA